MNRQNLDRKEVRLGMAQIVGILGLTVGSILAAFGLGFYSGRSAAFERELSNALASLPKLPVTVDEGEGDLGEKIVSEVYAKLNEQTDSPSVTTTENSASEDNAFPELSTIKESEIDDTEMEKESEDLGEVELENTEPNDLGSLVPDKEKTPEKGKTPEKETNSEKVLAQPTVKPTLFPTVKPTVKTADTPKPVEKTLGEVKQPKATPIVVNERQNSEILNKVTPKSEKLNEVAAKSKDFSNSKPPSGWYAQIAAPKEASDAIALASNLKKSGFSAVVETAEVRGEKYYRVIVGPEHSKSQADVLLKQLKRESYITGDPFLRMVK